MEGEYGPELSGSDLLSKDSEREEEDFDDSLLKAVARPAPMLRKPKVGEWLGGKGGHRFQILELLGGGAMGCVFRAWDEHLHRRVALKFLLPKRADEETAALLHQEARAIAQLDHENIVRIFDASDWHTGRETVGLPFLVMECLEGESLASLLRREQPELRRTLRILGEVAAGLAHAHGQHIIHRDLKPSNVFITREGRVKLLDFGLAHLLGSGILSPSFLLSAGTPAYMAPEQWKGEGQDERTDLWAAGVVLYELLTGEIPYHEFSLDQLRAQVTSPEPVPSVLERRPDLPWEIAALVGTALAKSPSQRFQTAQELCQELCELEEHFGFQRPAVTSPLQRRQVTLLACSLAGPANLASEPDREDLGELEAAFHQACAAAIQQRGGYLSLSGGNEVLACFGYPQVHEEDAESAVRTGLHLARHLPEEIQRRLMQRFPHPLAVKVGLHTATVALERSSLGARGQELALRGEALQVVTSLAKQAEPGTVWLSGTTWELVQGAFETQALGKRAFPWLSGTKHLDVHQVQREGPAVSRFDRKHLAGGLLPLVGRERQLEELLARWKQAQEGLAGGVLMYGEPGIGKSRLIREVGERVAAEGGLWLQCQCWSTLSTSALRPVIELLQHFLQEVPPEQRWSVLQERLGRLDLSSEAVHLLSSLLLLVPSGLPVMQLSAERRKEVTLEALVTLLRRVAAKRPVLAVVEDLHWADPSTLALLGCLLRDLEGMRVLLVLSARPEFYPPWSPRSGLHELKLARLPMFQIATVVRQATRGQMLPEEVVTQLAARTDGIPLFAEELARLMLGQSSASDSATVPHTIPLTLQELLLARLDRLPSRLRSLAQLGAVVGPSFSQALLAQLTSRSETALHRDLEGLVAADLLQQRAESTGPSYQFRHALLQEVAYQSLPRSTRRKHHRHIPLALLERFPEVVEAQPEVLAHHYSEAGDVEAAIRSWTRAGELASQRPAYEEAVRHLTHSLRLLRSLPESPERSGQELKLLLTLGVPLVQVQGYGSPEAVRTHARAQELFRAGGETMARLELPYWGLYAYHFSRANYSQARELAEHIVGLGQRRQDPELLAQGYRMMSLISMIWGQLHDAQAYARRAEDCSDFDLERHRAAAAKQWVNPRVAALSYGSVYQSMLDQPSEACRYGGEALELAWRIGQPHTIAFALLQVTIGYHFREDAQGVLKRAQEAARLADEHRFRMWRAWAAPLQSWAMATLGQPREGLSLMRKAIEYLRASGILAYQFHYNLGILADIHLRLGQPRAALATLDKALARLDAVGERFYEAELSRLRGEALRRIGLEEAARESFLQAIRVARAHGAVAFERKAMEALG
jgi:class 3 adenylate cyclase/tetratricopeptide (TPR) repeat protein